MKPEEFVLNFFKSMGFSIKKIKESQIEESPDFIVKDNESSYLVELKTKLDDPDKLKKRKESLQKGEIFENHESTGRKNILSRKIRKSEKQLASFREENIDFKLLWLYALGKTPDLKMRQFLATLYGMMYIWDVEKSGPYLPCFYFSFNEFYRSSEIIDGAIISTRQKAKLCLNNFSPRYMALKNSVLYRKFQGGICDPERLESEGKAYIADCDLDRSNKKAVLKYIQNKYNKRKLLDIEMKRHSVEFLLKRE